MTYADITDMAHNQDLLDRIIACAAEEGDPQPEQWAYANRWRVVAQPGWAAAWASAIAGNVDRPGRDAGVVTDGQILSAVQAVRGA